MLESGGGEVFGAVSGGVVPADVVGAMLTSLS